MSPEAVAGHHGSGCHETIKPVERRVSTVAIRDAVIGREIDILAAVGVQWKAGSRHIQCPYSAHADNHPSWRWDDRRKRAYCTCTRSDSIFDVIRKVKGVEFEAAKVATAEIMGRTDLIHQARTKTNGRAGVQSSGNNTATPQHRRGCTLTAYAKAKNLSTDSLMSFGVSETHYLSQPAIRIPYYSAHGREAAVRFRVTLDGKDKFRWRKGDKAQLYGLDRIPAAHASGEIAIVEGESDCHTLWHEGFPAVGLPGAGNWNEQRDPMIFDGIGTIFVVIEPDNGRR